MLITSIKPSTQIRERASCTCSRAHTGPAHTMRGENSGAEFSWGGGNIHLRTIRSARAARAAAAAAVRRVRMDGCLRRVWNCIRRVGKCTRAFVGLQLPTYKNDSWHQLCAAHTSADRVHTRCASYTMLSANIHRASGIE